METVLVIVVVALTVLAARAAGRVRDLESQVRNLHGGQHDMENQIARLVQRVYALERETVFPHATGPERAPTVEPLAVALEEIASAPSASFAPPLDAEPAPAPLPPPPPLPPAPPPRPPRRPLRERFGGEEWEALVGGSLLNRLGVLMLVIGVALFLGYSLTQFGPLGKITVGYVTALVLLLGGLALERTARYRVFSRGLVGGGWALLYFTTYAASGIDESRVIQSPALGFLLLLVVAVAMVAHALRYRSEAAVGVAFFSAFLALAVSPVTALSLLASLPLAAFLLAVADRFLWLTLPLAGLAFSYGSFALRYRADRTPETVGVAWAVVWLTWLSFEAFDLRQARRGSDPARSLFLLNAAGLAFVLLLPGAPDPFGSPFWSLALAGVAYLASAVLRDRLPKPEAGEAPRPWWTGTYEAALTLAALAIGLAVAQRFRRLGMTLGWLMEGELLVLAGLTLRRRYVQMLGAAVLAVAAVKILSVDAVLMGDRMVLGRAWQDWSGPALLGAGLAFLNRWLTGRTPAYTMAASLLLACVLGVEVAPDYRGLAWLLLGVALLGLSRSVGFPEAAYCAAAIGVVSFAATFFGVAMETKRPATVPVLSASAAIWSALAFAGWRRNSEVLVAAGVGAAGSLLAALFGQTLPEQAAPVAWAALVVVIVEMAVRRRSTALRWEAHALAFVTTVVLLWLLGDRSAWRTASVATAVLLYGAWVRLRTVEAMGRVERWAVRGYVTAATLIVVTLLGTRVASEWVAAAWGAYALALLAVGQRFGLRDLSRQSCVLALTAWGRAQDVNLELSRRVLVTAPVVAFLYVSQLLSPRSGEPMPDRYARAGFSLAATWLLTVLLFAEVSGRLLSVALGLEGVALLVAGFLVRERMLRLSGLAVFLFCIFKLFLYDLRTLDTPSRIASFLALGLLLLGASWIYTRFRDQIRRLL